MALEELTSEMLSSSPAKRVDSHELAEIDAAT